MIRNTNYQIDRVAQRRAWSILDQAFSAAGLVLVEGSDFDEIEALARASGMPLLEGHFAPDLNTYTPKNAFWLGLLDSEGLLVGRCTCRLDQLEFPMTLTEYWKKYFRRCYPAAGGGQVELAEYQPRFGQRITGDVAYIGGTQILPPQRGKGLGGYLNQMAQIVALEKWQAGFYYGWVQGFNFMDGFWRDCGFTQARHNALNWERLPATLDPNLVLVSNHLDDVCDMIDRIVGVSLSTSSGSRGAVSPSRSGTAESNAQE